MIFKKIRKGYADWRNFLCSTPARDYVFQKDAYEDQIDRAAKNIRNTDCVIIGAGAGASTAAGIQYGGKRFTDNFAEFIKKYGEYYMTDMYAAGFYPYPSEEAKWGYWSKHALMNRFDPPALPLYTELYDLVKNKEYFVLTTNVDHQFYKAGFDEKRIFATQGDYGKIQCQKACHSKTYDAKDLFRKMDKARRDCLIPSELVPKCPVCGGNMAMNLRCDNYFVEDEAWHEAADRYAGFLEQHKDKKVVLLELGVGFNTPIIIRFPFEKMVRENSSYSLIRLNMDEAVVPESFGERAISNDFLKIQDEYLTERNIERGITDVDTLAPVKSDSRLYIWQGNITTLKCDAIVNACNSQMLGCFSPMHACIDNFIHTYAGMELRLKMHEIMAKQGHEEETGKAKITSGYNLPTKYILHTVGPIIQWKVTKEDEDLLASCYTECLKLAADTGVESIAFCCLSTGVFRFPQQRAAEIATSTVKQYLNKDSRIKKVIFNVFKDEDLKIYSGLL